MHQALRALAACIVTLANSIALADRTSDPIPKLDPTTIGADIAELASDAMNGRAFRTEDGRRAAQWVADKLAAAGAVPLAGRDSMLVPIARMPAASPNVVAWIPPAGPKPSGEYILVTAHYDHLPPKSGARAEEDAIYNGADDNASGTCGMIAVANAMRADALDVGVVFVAFTGEEAGLIGSRAFVEEETLPIARLRGVFNLDMISRQPDGAIRLDGGEKGKPLTDVLVRLAPLVPLEMKVDTHPDWLSRSDQGAFLAVGVPAVLFSCEDHEDYHRVTDHADKIDAVLAAKVSALVVGAVRTFAVEMSPRFDTSPFCDDLGVPTRTIRVGRTMPNPPYWKPATRRDPDRGVVPAILDALSQERGWKFEEKAIPIGGEVTALESGEVDLIANGTVPMAIDDARAESLASIAFVTQSGVGALVAALSPLQNAKDFEVSAGDGLRLGVRSGTAGARWRALFANKSTAVMLNGPEGVAASQVEKSELTAILGDLLSLTQRAARDPAFRVIVLDRAPNIVLTRAADRRFLEALAPILDGLRTRGVFAPSLEKAGLSTHAVIGQDKGRVKLLSPTGSVEWEYPCDHNSHDLQVLANGNFLLHPASDRIIEVTRDKRIVWEWRSQPVAPYVGRVEIHGFQRLADGNTMIAETGNLRILEVTANGAIVKAVPILVERPDAHRDTRRVRKTDAGTYLVCHEGLGLVREYNASGQVIWEYTLDLNGQPATGGHDGHGTSVFHALRLPNGNTLIGGGNNNRVMEVTAEKKIVWSIERDELKRPDGRAIRLCWVTSLQALPNGNIIVGNTHAGPEQPQMFEVTRAKKVVWMLDDWSAFGNDLCTGWCLDLPEGTLR